MIPKSQVPKDENLLGVLFVLAVKNVGSPDEKSKARYISQGQKEKDNPYMFHDSAPLRSISVRLILSIASMNGFHIFCMISTRRMFIKIIS